MITVWRAVLPTYCRLPVLKQGRWSDDSVYERNLKRTEENARGCRWIRSSIHYHYCKAVKDTPQEEN